MINKHALIYYLYWAATGLLGAAALVFLVLLLIGLILAAPTR
jgi:hypothetical protein